MALAIVMVIAYLVFVVLLIGFVFGYTKWYYKKKGVNFKFFNDA